MSSAGAESLLTPAEVAAAFRVDPKTVTRWARNGKLTSIRTLGGHRRYRESEVRALLAGGTGQHGEKAPDPLAAPVHTLWTSATPLGMAARNRLRDAGITTVGHLVDRDAADLRGYGLSAVHVDEVRLALYRKGLALHGEILGQVA
jgi:excisionase family DNA binding protein